MLLRSTHANPRRESSLRLAVAGLAVVALTGLPLAAASAEAPGAHPSGGPQVRHAQSSLLLPAWARTAEVSGARQVWVLPVYDAGEPRWDERELLSALNGDLAWFAEMSRDRFTMTATKVLEPLAFDSRHGSSCDSAARVLAPALSRFYAETPAGTHLVALTRSSDCPYSAIGDTPGRSLILTGYSPSSEASRLTLLHELGHNLGLPHSSGYAGSVLSSSPTPRELSTKVIEYGAMADVMGSRGAVARLSAASLAALGWGDGVSEIPGGAAGTFLTTLPEVSRPGPDAVVVDDPVSGTRYSFTYVDAPSEPAAGAPTAGRGVYLHEVRRGTASHTDYGRSSFSLWMPWEGHDSGSSMGIGAGTGTGWVSPTGAISMTVQALHGESARIEVRVDPAGGLTDTVGPTWPLAPSIESQPGRALATLRLPAAWDQSGVTRYRVIATGAKVLSVRTPTDLVFAGTATLALTRPRATVRVIATDGAGNSTTWSQRVAARG